MCTEELRKSKPLLIGTSSCMEKIPPGMDFFWPSCLIYCTSKCHSILHIFFRGLPLFGITLVKCFGHCLVPFLECELHEVRTSAISWGAVRASGTYCNFFWENPRPPSVCVFSWRQDLPCAAVLKHVQTQPKPTSTFHLVARQPKPHLPG